MRWERMLVLLIGVVLLSGAFTYGVVRLWETFKSQTEASSVILPEPKTTVAENTVSPIPASQIPDTHVTAEASSVVGSDSGTGAEAGATAPVPEHPAALADTTADTSIPTVPVVVSVPSSPPDVPERVTEKITAAVPAEQAKPQTQGADEGTVIYGTLTTPVSVKPDTRAVAIPLSGTQGCNIVSREIRGKK